MAELPRFAFYVCAGLLFASIAIIFLRMSSPSQNRRLALQWFKSMDVISHGQRYKGDRSDIVFDAGSGRVGTFAYQLMVGCRTKSGREYFLRVGANLGLVTEWEIAPALPGEFNDSMDPTPLQQTDTLPTS